jgi:uncharacterized metal-binding protein
MAKKLFNVRDLMIAFDVTRKDKTKKVQAAAAECGGTSVCCTVCSIDREMQLNSDDAVALYKNLERQLQASLKSVAARRKQLSRQATRGSAR